MVAVLYVIGLLVSNEYLMYWGISDFSSFRPKCVLTGTWTVILLTGFLLPVIAPFLLIPSITFKTTQGIKQIFKTAVIGAVVGLGVDYGVLNTIT